jgi:hypothetical protein
MKQETTTLPNERKMNMKKIVIAGMLATALTGSGLLALTRSSEAAAAPAPTPAATNSPAPQAGQNNPPAKQPSGSQPSVQQPQGQRPPGQQPHGQRPPGQPPQDQDGSCPRTDTAPAPKPNRPANRTSTSVQGDYTVTISGGFDTDPVDHGRPVVLIAAALGVPTEVFREAFSGVTPAGLDRAPTAEEAQRNKAALLNVLAPYGITNDRLDEVSDYYRYNGKGGGIWKTTPATVTPVITDGKVTGVTITNPGAGYSSAPTVTITGPDGTVTAKATIAYTKDFGTNGSLSSISLD